MENSLPNGWIEIELKHLGEYINGRAFKPTEWKTSGLPIIRIQNLNNSEASYNFSDKEHEEKYRVKKGDLLMAWSASLGVYIWQREDAWLNQHIFKVLPNAELVTKKFLFYALKEAIDDFYQKTHGSGMVHITKPVFEAHKVPLPPLAEQHRIVAKLDALLAKATNCKNHLEKIPALLKNFRQNVLAAAVSGELSEHWRKKNKHVCSLGSQIEKYILSRKNLSQSFKSENRFKSSNDPWTEFPDIPETWYWCTSEEIVEEDAEIVYGIVQPGPKLNVGVPYVRGMDIQDGKILVDQLLKTSPETAKRYERASLKENDVLLGIIRNTKVALVPKQIEGANITQGTARLRPSKFILPKFLELYLVAERTQKWLHAHYRGIDMPGLNLRDVRKLPISVPPLEEQKEIVRKVEALFHFADSIEARYQKAKAWFDKLPQAILAKAFRGELAAQDENDEPASVLLERIKKERKTNHQTKGSQIVHRRRQFEFGGRGTT